ncbi:hypothetical protein OSH08_18325 [Kaistia geumhonensis]|uniref:Transcriptional regulator n=1 Tax=Kaistia geumhonensis TaxID=410839 RepID=A0ABU0MAL6_9HYPH|nr:hypothetical protein [Kaistia geumhonensis]MCX5480963.1 hypothetical protein [Kaistia geumhonensis]MDQ0518020.1 hypothetical protein [Kaistia geumhonensis]
MTDYYAVLKRAVGGLEHESVDVRRSIYDKARAALLGQLKAITPPLGTAEISRQRLELEEAIRRVEREAAVTAAGPSPARARAAAAAAEAMAAQVMRSPEEDVSEEGAHPAPAAVPQRPAPRATPVPPDFRPGLSAAERTAPPIRAASPESPRADVSPRIDPEDAPRRPLGRGPRQEPVRQEPTLQNAARQDFAAEELPHQEPVFETGRRREPGFDPARDRPDAPRHAEAEDIVAPVAAEERSEWPDDSLDEEQLVADEPVERRPRREKRPRAAQAAASVEKSRSSRLPAIIIGVLVLLMVGGIAALGWSQRARVNDVIGDLISTDKGAAPSAEAPSESGSPKNADRLGDAPAEDVVPRSVRTITATPPAEGTEPDPLAGVMQPDSGAPAADAAPDATEPTAPLPGTDGPVTLPGATAPQSDAAPATTQSTSPGDDLVAQKAILYEQPLNGATSVTALSASVVWKFEPDTPNGPEIVATATVPERDLKVTVNFRKNTDTALPASHLVEVIVDTPAGFPGGGIKAVPALVMKPTEESRGQPLDGAAAKVADGYFWIAFANDGPTMQQNIALLRERNWIDIPIVYDNDQRAILTLEKGTPGQRVFDKAFAAWGN